MLCWIIFLTTSDSNNNNNNCLLISDNFISQNNSIQLTLKWVVFYMEGFILEMKVRIHYIPLLLSIIH